MDAPDDVTTRHIWDGTQFVAPLPIPPLLNQSDLDNAMKREKAIVLAAAILSGRTSAEAKVAFKQAWDSLL